MPDQDDPDSTPGYSRRTLIQRGAVAGGVLWAAPVVESFTNKAYAQVASPFPEEPPEPGIGGISYVALLISCNGVCTVVKIDVDGSTASKAPGTTTPSTPCCSEMSSATCSVGSADTPAGLVVQPVDADGFQRVTLPTGCTLVDYRVHCGQCCDGPGAIGQPQLPPSSGGVFLFNQCSGTGNDNHPCSELGYQWEPCGNAGRSGGGGGGGGAADPKAKRTGRAAAEPVLDDAELGHPAEDHVDPLF